MLSNRLLPSVLARRSGYLVFIASMHSKLPTALISVYNVTKFGLRGFGLALGKELPGSGVGVSVINPTFVSEAGMWAETGVATPPPTFAFRSWAGPVRNSLASAGDRLAVRLTATDGGRPKRYAGVVSKASETGFLVSSTTPR